MRKIGKYNMFYQSIEKNLINSIKGMKKLFQIELKELNQINLIKIPNTLFIYYIERYRKLEGFTTLT